MKMWMKNTGRSVYENVAILIFDTAVCVTISFKFVRLNGTFFKDPFERDLPLSQVPTWWLWLQILARQLLNSYLLLVTRIGKIPPIVRTAVPVDGRFEHIVLSCNMTSDHAIIWIERESQRALDVSFQLLLSVLCSNRIYTCLKQH